MGAFAPPTEARPPRRGAGDSAVNDGPIDLDTRRGMTAQKETEIRRTLSGERADQAVIELRQREFEEALESSPAAGRHEAVAKAVYLLKLYGATQDTQSPLRARLVARTLEDLNRLFGPGTEAG